MILSKTRNGVVRKTAGRGFSPKVIARQLERICKENDLVIVFENHARTGSIYYTVEDMEVRISNHTTRNYLDEEMEAISTLVNRFGEVVVYSLNITCHDSKEEVFEYLRSLKA